MLTGDSLYAILAGSEDGRVASSPQLSVTRVINPCALISVDGGTVLTDPFFTSLRRLPMNEPIGMRADQLPALAAVLGGHGAFDHWQLEPLRGIVDPGVPVLVPHRRMAARATKLGFTDVRETADGERVAIAPSVSVLTVAGDRVMRRPTNHYVIAGDAGVVYVGTEACSLEPMRRIGGTVPIDVAVLPIDGLTFAGKQLVMDAGRAIEAARILGVRVLVPFHHSQRSIRPLIHCRSGIDELLAHPADGTEVRHAPTGVTVELGDLLRDPGSRR